MKEEVYEFFESVQFKSWWFNSRRKIVDAFISPYLHERNYKILDIGSGCGSLIPVLTKYGVIDAIEPYKNSHKYLKKLGVSRIHDIDNFPETYPEEKYDIVTLFDVIEHIKNDKQCLKIVKNHLLKPNGICFITVPAYMWLWGKIDEMTNHYRRYTKKELSTILHELGFKNIRITYFMSALFPYQILLSFTERLNLNRVNFDLKYFKKPSFSKINNIFEKVSSTQSKFISNFNYPFGGSIIAKVEF